MATSVPKALAKIDYRDRNVYVSGTADDLGSMLRKPVHDRIRSNSDDTELDVRWAGSDDWETAQRLQWLQRVTDLVLLLDDTMIEVLRKASADVDDLTEATLDGRELIVVMRRNDDRGEEGEPLARIWVAKAAGVELIGLRRIAGCTRWNLEREDNEQRLHWLYPATEKVLTGDLVKNRLVGEDETRLAQRVNSFVIHPKGCPRCGKVHREDDPYDKGG